MTAHGVLDLETMGTVPGSAICSIGLALVVDGHLDESFHWAVNWRDQGRIIMPDTAAWWTTQPEAVRASELRGTQPLALALGMLAGTLSRYNVVGIWGNGAAFDNAIIHDATHQLDCSRLWPYKLDMCLRTLRALAPDVAVDMIGAPHCAEDDAIHQAELLIAIHKKLGLPL